MALDIDAKWAFEVYLLSVRLGVLFMMAPFLAGLEGFVTVRVLLTLAFSAMFVGGALPIGHVTANMASIVSATFSEVLTGSVMVFGVFAAFASFSVAGKVIDVQSGFGIGSVYDPVTRAGAPVFATLLNMTATVAFFGMDAHHALVRGIAFSLQQVPLGTTLSSLPVDAVVHQFGLMFSLGVALIIPVLLILLLVEMGLAVVSRVLPQMNVIMVMVPAKVAAAFLVFALTSATLQAPMSRVFASIFTYWEEALT